MMLKILLGSTLAVFSTYYYGVSGTIATISIIAFMDIFFMLVTKDWKKYSQLHKEKKR